ncbi:MAG: hypothetical protein IPO58_07315 [Betaproteobacteria bacterium]|nr:hypothetical protein [Betaproteobacteria bacterium]
MHVIPVCPFIAAYLRKHREFIDLVKPEVQVAFKVSRLRLLAVRLV